MRRTLASGVAWQMPKSHVRKPKKAAAQTARTERRRELKRILAKHRCGDTLSREELKFKRWAIGVEVDAVEARDEPDARCAFANALLRRLRSGESLTAEEHDYIDRALADVI